MARQERRDAVMTTVYISSGLEPEAEVFEEAIEEAIENIPLAWSVRLCSPGRSLIKCQIVPNNVFPMLGAGWML